MITNFCKTVMTLCLGFVMLIVISSCHKDKKDSCGINMTSLSGTYKLTSLKYKMSATAPEQDYLALLDDCQKDDIITLNPDGTYDYKDLGSVCTPNGGGTGTWSLTGNVISSDGI